MSDTTPLLTLPYILPAQAQKHVTHNEALRVLDSLVQMRVLDFEQDVPPAEPAVGDIYGLGTNPTADWVGQGGKIAVWDGTAWAFLPPQEGWRTWSVADTALRVYSQGTWQGIIPPLQNLGGVGVGTTSDATNRLAVASDATLLSHAGGGHQVKVNKAGAGDTASLLFQSGFAGHAEMGLAGDTTFRIKVSDDGSTFHDGLAVRPTDGGVSAPSLTSARVTVAEDSATGIPTPGTGGIVAIAVQGQSACGGLFAFDTSASGSLSTLAAGADIDNLGTGALGGTTGASGKISVAVGSGVLQVESRLSGSAAEVSVTYLSVF